MMHSRSAHMQVFVQLAYGFGGKNWKKRWENGEIIGINEPQAYGYYRAASEDVNVVYSEDTPENSLQKLMRLGVRAILGFDLIHAWRNRRQLLMADVVWTHTESQTLAVLAILALLRPLHRPKIVGQVVWLLDKWNRCTLLHNILYRRLLRSLDVMTLHSSLNYCDAKRLFPKMRIEQVMFGIRADEMCEPALRNQSSSCKIISLGNDIHRDWPTLLKASMQMPQVSLCIASKSHLAHKLSRTVQNAEILHVKTNNELLAFYNSADMVVVTLHPNRHASGLTVIQEAFIRGIPVIATDTGGLRDYFSDEMVLYVPPHDPKALQDAILALYASPEKCRNMVIAGQKRIRTSINSNSYAHHHVQLSRDLLHNNIHTPLTAQPNIVVGIATSKRPALLAELVRQLKKQSFQPCKIIISYSIPDDIIQLDKLDIHNGYIELIKGRQGLPAQRNTILDCLTTKEDIIVFFDDDFFPHIDYLAEIVRAFQTSSDILGLTGHVLADGAQGPGIPSEEANRLNRNFVSTSKIKQEDVFNTYGCNMAFRIDAIKKLQMRFDERLPLYAWYEDIDFSRSLLPYGRLVKTYQAVGVHLGNKTGKTSGLRLGYSQIINPIYLAQKGTFPWDHAIKSVARHLLINLLKTLRPEGHIDRRGRTQGNWIGVMDLLKGRVTPERALYLTSEKTR